MLLITGGLGYIGSHTVLKLLETDIDCCIIDNLSNSDKTVHKKLERLAKRTIPYYIGDIADQQLLEEIFSKHNIEGVIHFAGYKSVAESCSDPFEYYHNNVIGTIKLLEVMEKNDCRKILFSSSATVYNMEDPNKTEFTESDRCGVISNPYGTTKLLIENIIEDLTKHKQRSGISLRYFNPIGAHPSGELGETTQGVPNNLFPYIFEVLRGTLEQLTVFGSDYDTRDGTCIRDYIDILDLVDGHFKAWKKITNEKKPYYDIFNLGTGNGISVLEAVDRVENALKKTISKRIGKRRIGDKPCFFANTSKAEKILSWKSSNTLETSIKNTWNFIKKAL